MNNNEVELKTLIFSVAEVWAALFSLRIENLVMFEDISSYQPKDEDMIYALRDMVRRELMEYSEDKVRLTELGKSYFEPLKSVLYCFFENCSQNQRPTRAVYFCENAVRIIEPDERKKGYVKISAEKADHAVEDILEMEFIPKDASRYVEDAGPEGIDKLTADELKDRPEILYMIDRFPRNRAEKDLRIVIKRGNIADSIIVSDGSRIRSIPFQPENMKLIYRMAESCKAEEILEYDFS